MASIDDAEGEPPAGAQDLQGATLLPGLVDAHCHVLSDTDRSPGFWPRLLRLAEAGLSPIEALRAATLGGAAALGRPELGRVAVGRPADLVAVDGQPDKDLAVLTRPESIALVMKGGQPVSPGWASRPDTSTTATRLPRSVVSRSDRSSPRSDRSSPSLDAPTSSGACDEGASSTDRRPAHPSNEARQVRQIGHRATRLRKHGPGPTLLRR